MQELTIKLTVDQASRIWSWAMSAMHDHDNTKDERAIAEEIGKTVFAQFFEQTKKEQ